MKAKDMSSLGTYLKLMLKDHFKEGDQTILQESCGISDESITDLYQEAFDLYNQRRASEAASAFGLLIAMDPFSQVFWMGLAAARQLGEEYDKALQAFALASLLDDQNPAPHYHAAQCYLALKNEKEATKALNLAEALIHENPSHAAFKERVMQLKSCYYQRECYGDY